MNITHFSALLLIILFLVATLDNNELEIQKALANEYADMLNEEAKCETWQCIKDLK